MTTRADPRDIARSVGAAEWFAGQGVGIVEVHGTPLGSDRLKVPVGEAWQRKATRSPDTIRERITKQGGQYGLRVMSGSRALGLDIDYPAEFPWDSLPPGAVQVRHGDSPKAHVWVRLPDGVDPATVPAKHRHGETATEAQRHLVGPGSIHPDGTLYEVVSGPLPAALPELDRRTYEMLTGEPFSTNGTGPTGDAEAWTWDPDTHGSRHDLLLGRVRKWRGDGLTREAIMANLRRYMERHAIPRAHAGRAISEAELEAMVAGAFHKYPEDEPEPGHPTGAAEVHMDGLAVVVEQGPRTLRLQPTAGGLVRVDAVKSRLPAMVRGMADVYRVQSRMSLARHLGEAEVGSRGGDDAMRPWLGLVETAVAFLEAQRPSPWFHDLTTDMQPPGPIRWRLEGMTRPGEDATLVAHRSRLKTWTLLAHDLSLLTGRTLLPGFPVGETVTDVVHLNYENSADMVRSQAVKWLNGAGIDPAEVSGRFHVLAPPPDMDVLVEEVLEMVSAMPQREGGLRLHVSMDSAESAIGTTTLPSGGDSWGAGATALFDFYRAVRQVSGHADLSSLTLDHAGGDKPKDVDTMASFHDLTEYGSRRKTDRARGALRCAKLRHEPDDVLLAFGTLKPWPDAGPAGEVFVRYRFTETSVVASADSKPRSAYPDSITGRETLAAYIYDVLTEAGSADPETGEWMEPQLAVEDVMEHLQRADRDTRPANIRQALNQHPDAFVRVDDRSDAQGRYAALWQRVPVL